MTTANQDSSDSENNPYAPPQIDLEPILAPTRDVVGFWRESRHVVVHIDYVLPLVCARTMQPADSYYLLPISFFRTQCVQIPVSKTWKTRRWIYFWLFLLGTVAVPMVGIPLSGTFQNSDVQFGLMITSILGAILCLLLANDQFSPFVHISSRGNYVSVQGFCRAYRNNLPLCPGKQHLREPVPENE